MARQQIHKRVKEFCVNCAKETLHRVRPNPARPTGSGVRKDCVSCEKRYNANYRAKQKQPQTDDYNPHGIQM